MQFKTLSLAVATLCASPCVFAQPAANKLEPVIVTATRTALALPQALGDVTVLTRADIERQSLANLADLLKQQACFELGRAGGPTGTASLFLRGANTQHTVLLVDGVRMDTQSGSGGASWGNIPLAQIERIEIVRGAASGVYGSDAVAGVVQVFTRKGTGQPNIELGASLGSLGAVKGDLSLSGLVGGLDYALSLSQEVSDGFNVRPVAGQNPDRDDWRQAGFSARLGYQINKQQRLEFSQLVQSADGGYDSDPKPSVNDRSLQDQRATRLQWSANWTPEWQSELSLAESTDRYEVKPTWPYVTETQVRAISLRNSLKLGTGQLNAVLERREDELLNASVRTNANGQSKRHQSAAALGYVLNLGALDAQVHARHDQDSSFGGINTGTVAAGYRLAPAWRVWSSVGTAFRAPTLYQSFSSYGPKDGLPALQAERGRNAELGLDYNAGDDSLSLTAYRNRVSNLISYDAAFNGSCPAVPDKAKAKSWDGCYGNLAKVRLQGISIQAGTRVDGLKLNASLDLQRPIDVDTGLMLGRRAKVHGQFNAEHSFGAWDLSGQWQLSAKRFDRNDNKTTVAGYGVLNLQAQYHVNKALRYQISVTNVADRAYQTAAGYAETPRMVFVGLRYSPTR